MLSNMEGEYHEVGFSVRVQRFAESCSAIAGSVNLMTI